MADTETKEKDPDLIEITKECLVCAGFEHSTDKKPAVPPSGNVNLAMYECGCGRRWWQTNQGLHLWQEVTSRKSWSSMIKDVMSNRYGGDEHPWED